MILLGRMIHQCLTEPGNNQETTTRKGRKSADKMRHRRFPDRGDRR
jgi:hypothetical protein